MPSGADDLIPGFDDIDLEQRPVVEEDLWVAKAPKKSKKKKAKKVVEEDVIFAPDEVVEEPVLAATLAPADEVRQVGGNDGDVRVWGGGKEVNGGMFEDILVPQPDSQPPLDEPVEPQRALQQSSPPLPPNSYPALPNLSPRPALAVPAPTSLTPPTRPASLNSPPAQHARLANYRQPNSTTPQSRRESYTASRASPAQRFVEPMGPPHMVQTHFYGLPDFGFGQKKDVAGKLPGADGYCCCFDSFADAGDAASAKKARTALLVGSEGALDVYRVLPNKVEVVGRLEGLRGSVIGAKVLPHVELADALQSLRPLIAVVVHGVMVESAGDAWEEEREGFANGAPVRYQTSVDVYSLQTHEYLATLFKTLPVVLEQPTIGHLSTIPRPVGDLRVSAQGKYISVGSGKSGEVYIFSHTPTAVIDGGPMFRCLGKFWTSLQSSLDRPTSRATSSSDGSAASDEAEKKPGVPLLSLSQRWLAIVPPPHSTNISIQGTPLLASHSPNTPGVSTHSAPPQPPITCDIAGLDSEGAWGRLTRQAAQGLVKYSQKGFELSRQGWNELVYPTTQTTTQHGRAPSKEDMFPPTNAPPADSRKESREPAVVSVLDLDALLEAEEARAKYAPSPVATFALEEGCNHVSLSSTGLKLLTVSRKGEVWSTWDLKQAIHGVANHSTSDSEDAALGPCLKQLLRVPRSSQCVVTESIWSRDDEYLAILTTHGTVHLHEVPSRPISRKRKRRSTHTVSAEKSPALAPASTPGTSPPQVSSNNFFSSIRSGFQQVGTQVTSLRSSGPAVPSFAIPTLADIRDTAASAGQAGSRALARGLSQSYSAARSGATDYLHADDNKIRNSALKDAVGYGQLRWVKRQSGTLIAIVAGGKMFLHSVSRVERRRGELLIFGLKHEKGRKDFSLPPIRTAEDNGGVMERVKRADECAAAGPHGFWSLRLPSSPAPRRRGGSRGSDSGVHVPAQASEVETNPAYCPFHVDSSVGVYAFGEHSAGTGSQIRLFPSQNGEQEEDTRTAFFSQGQCDASPSISQTARRSSRDDQQSWMFGDALPGSTKMNTHEDLVLDDFHHDFGQGDDVAVEEDEFGNEGVEDEDSEALREQVESRMTIVSDSGKGEEIRVHTRKAKGRG